MKAKLRGNAGIGQLIPPEHVAVIQGKWVPSQGKGGGLSKLDHFSRKDFGKFKLAGNFQGDALDGDQEQSEFLTNYDNDTQCT